MRTELRRCGALARRAGLICLLGLGAGSIRASLWESRDWALLSTIDTAVGYDSNLTLAHDGPEDEFVQARPQLQLLRRNSVTDFHADFAATGTDFLHGRLPSETDYNLGASYAFPSGLGIIPRYKADVAWTRTAEPNPYLGHRVRHSRGEASGEAFFPVSGKLGVRAEADAFADNYVDPTLNHNQRWRVLSGVTYEKRPGLEGSVNVAYAEGESRPNQRDLMGVVHSKEVDITARARGTITAKISGNVYAGFGQVRYTGGYHNRYNLPIAGADLTWGIDPRRTVVLAAYSGADYAPDGQAVNTTHAFLSFTHVVIERWQYILRGGPTHTTFRREVRQSTDNAWEGGVEFAYVPSQKFRVSAGLSGRTQDSDVRDRRYDRVLFSLSSAYRF